MRKDEIQKVSKIIDVFVSYFLMEFTTNLSVNVDEDNDKFIIGLEAKNVNIGDEEIQRMTYLLNVERQREMEVYYWQLADNDLEGEEINLVGMMVDDVVVKYENKILNIKLIRVK